MKTRETIDRADEARWVTDLKSGNEAAFERLVATASAPLHAVAKRVLRHREDAEDAVQDAFLSAFRGLREFHGDARVSTWVHRVGVNAALLRQRSKSRRPERTFSALAADVAPETEFALRPLVAGPEADDGLEGFRAVERSEKKALLNRCLGEISSGHRELIRMRDLDGVDTAEAARRLGITANAAKIRLHRARRALRGAVERRLAVA